MSIERKILQTMNENLWAVDNPPRRRKRGRSKAHIPKPYAEAVALAIGVLKELDSAGCDRVAARLSQLLAEGYDYPDRAELVRECMDIGRGFVR